MSSTPLTYAQTVEGVVAAISAYSQAVDDGHTRALADLFCPDGILDLPTAHLVGPQAIFERLSAKRPDYAVRHLVVNYVVTQSGAHAAAAVSDLVVLNERAGGWVIDQVGRYLDTLHYRDGGWRFHTRRLVFVDQTSK